jgi:GTP cyclohydrolase II
MIKDRKIEVWKYSEANLPTRHGHYRVIVFRTNEDEKEHLAVMSGDIGEGENIPVRLHSECLTSEVLGSLKCDCNDQLEMALQYISEYGKGIVLYLRQEGRGIGLGNKIRAYALQEVGYDTVEANHILGFADDLRNYEIAANILKNLGVQSVKLLTNNPTKVTGLERNGIEVSGRIPIQIRQNHVNKFYLMTKAKKSGHLLEFEKPMDELRLVDEKTN